MIEKLDPVQLGNIGEAAAAQAIPAFVPLGISGASSISSATMPLEKISAAIKRPFLPPPEPHYVVELLKIERKMTDILHQGSRQFEIEIDSDLKRLEKFNLEKIQMLKEHAKELQSKEQWAAWQVITEYVGFSSVFAFGVACLASGGAATIPGLFFMASGGLGLLNRVGADSTAWRWAASWINANHQTQVHYAQNAERRLSAIALALSIGGVFSAYHANVFEQLDALDRAMQAIGYANTGLTLSLRAGEKLYERRVLNIQADMKRMSGKTAILSSEISMNTAEVVKMFKLSEEIDAMIKAAIASTTA